MVTVGYEEVLQAAFNTVRRIQRQVQWRVEARQSTLIEETSAFADQLVFCVLNAHKRLIFIAIDTLLDILERAQDV